MTPRFESLEDLTRELKQFAENSIWNNPYKRKTPPTMPPRTTQAITRTYFEDIELEELCRFLCTVKDSGTPGTAKVEINVERGDPKDPREAGHKAVTLKIRWRE